MAEFVYAGCYSEPIRVGTGQILHGRGRGIYRFELDRAAGKLTPLGVVEGVRNPSYLAFDPARRFLFCVNEFKEFEGQASGAVSAFRIDPATGDLTFLNTVASRGTDPCHLMVDATGRFVLIANFASGSLAVLPIESDGRLGDAVAFVQHEGSSIDPRRQAGPHAHAVAIDAANRFVFVPDLGIDATVIYAFDAATGAVRLNPAQPRVPTAPGAGPRQLVFHPDGRFAYLINELDSTVTAYRYAADTGSLTPLGTWPTLPTGYHAHSTCAEVQISPDGRHLYGSNRGFDALAIFAIDAVDGTLSPLGHESTRGRIPRHFEISPCGEFIAIANQDTNTVLLFHRDAATGRLTPTGDVVDVGTPVCVRFR
jgi:6-phosphogluconolactonase